MFDTHEGIKNTLIYGIFVIIGILAGVLYYLWDTRDKRKEGAGVIVTSALIFGFIGSKIPLLFETYDLKVILTGKSIVGALIGGMFGIIFIKKKLNIKSKFGNVIAPAIALGMSIGRLGCFYGGCCYGKISTWGFNFGDGNLRLPTQLFEMAFHAVAFVILNIFKRKALVEGILFKIYIVSYFMFRFFIEFIRENKIIFLGLTIYQIFCLIGIFYLILMIKRSVLEWKKTGSAYF